MNPKVKEIIQWFYKWAPPELAESWDSIGLQIGDPNQTVQDILVALEVDEAVLDTLSTKKKVLVITHHPLFFKPLKRIRYDQDMGTILSAFIIGQHQLFTAHTNLDAATGGVNDCLIKQFGLIPKNGNPLEGVYGKFFDKPSLTYQECCDILPHTKRGAIHDEPIKRLAFCGGSGHGFISRVVDLGVDTFITGEITYHDHVTCRMNGVRVIELGHKESEQYIVSEVVEHLKKSFPMCNIDGCS